nr:asparagine synthase [Streptomyces typhae]
MIVVRERVADRNVCEPSVRHISPAVYDEAKTALAHWPADYVAVEVTGDEPVRVTAGPCRTTPLYLAHDEVRLYGSWDMAELRAHARQINVREAARLLLYRPRYSHDTLFDGIHRLTERSTAHFGGHLYLRYPEPALHTGPRELTPGADVLGAFAQALDGALDVRPLDAQHTVFHLTGGFDSGTAALRAAQRYPGKLNTAALLIAGPGRAQQVRRRREMRAAVPFGPLDDVVDATVELPLHPACARVRGEPISPYEEPLHHPFTVMAARIAEHGAHTVATGLGGDEMVALSQAEHPHRASGRMEDGEGLPWIGHRVGEVADFSDVGIAPPAPVNSMTLLSLETSAPVLLRAGLWPLHPFADPGMVALGEALPMDWRALKQLQRRRLAALGLSRDVVWPAERESFAEVVATSLITYGKPLLKQILSTGSPLFDTGLIDPDGLARGMQALDHGRYEERRDSQLIEVIHLHQAATAFL